MFKGLGNMASMMKQAQEMQGKMKEMQESLGSLKVEGSAGGGMVVVEASGPRKILSIRIEEELIGTDDKEMLEDLITAATNQALDKAKELAAEEMAKLTGGMDLPGLGDAMSKLGLG